MAPSISNASGVHTSRDEKFDEEAEMLKVQSRLGYGKGCLGYKKLPRVLIFFLGFKVNSLNYATVVELGKPRFGGLIRSFLLAIYVLSIYIYIVVHGVLFWINLA